MWPTAENYFTEVDRQGRMGPINKAKLQIGMPENITHPSQIERPSVDSPRPGYEQSGGAARQRNYLEEEEKQDKSLVVIILAEVA